MPGNSQHRVIKGVDLSERESQVLDLFCQGKCTKEAAAELQLSPKTVEYFRTKLYDKLSPKRRSDLELVARGARMGFGFLECIWCEQPLDKTRPVEFRGFCNKSCYEKDRYIRVRHRKIKQAKARQDRIIEKAHSLGMTLKRYLQSLKVAAAAAVLVLGIGLIGPIVEAQEVAVASAPTNRIYSLTFAWDASASPGITNYAILGGTNSGAYFFTNNFGTNLTGRVTNLVSKQVYYFAAQAFSTNGSSPVGTELKWPPAFMNWTVVGVVVDGGTNLTGPWTTLGSQSLLVITNALGVTNPAQEVFRTRSTITQSNNWLFPITITTK